MLVNSDDIANTSTLTLGITWISKQLIVCCLSLTFESNISSFESDFRDLSQDFKDFEFRVRGKISNFEWKLLVFIFWKKYSSSKFLQKTQDAIGLVFFFFNYYYFFFFFNFQSYFYHFFFKVILNSKLDWMNISSRHFNSRFAQHILIHWSLLTEVNWKFTSWLTPKRHHLR